MKHASLKDVNYEKVRLEIGNAIRSKDVIPGANVYDIAYYHFLASRCNNPICDPHDLLSGLLKDGEIDEEIYSCLIEAVDRTRWTGEDYIFNRFSRDELLSYLFYGMGEDGVFAGERAMPRGLARLVIELLNIQEGESVFDIGCGEGFFLTEGALASPSAHYTGIEINATSATHCKMRAAVANEIAGDMLDITVMHGNCFDIDPRGLSADKAFSQYPFGMHFRDIRGHSGYFMQMKEGLPEYGRPASADWAFNRYLIDSIKEDGKAIGVVRPNILTESVDSIIRSWFVDNGLIEAVILLPGRLLQGISIPLALVVFSHGNESVRFVDATDVCKRGRRTSVLEENDVKEIVALCSSDEPYAASHEYRGSAVNKSLEEIADERYSLSPRRYIDGGLKIKNPAKFGDYIETINRGVTLRASELDEISTKVDTGIRYLTPGEIDGGLVSESLPSLKELDSKLFKHQVSTGDIVFGRAGRPFKIAVMEVPHGTVIVPNANLFVLRLKAGIDPYYIAAFFNSGFGQELLFRRSAGTTIPSLSVEDIKGLEFPMPTSDEEKSIGETYRAKLDEIRIYASRLAKAKAELADLFEEEN